MISKKKKRIFSSILCILIANITLFHNRIVKANDKLTILEKNTIKNDTSSINRNKIRDLDNFKIEEDFYIIGPGDILELKLFDAPEFSGKIAVLNDGSSIFPLIGRQKLIYLTLQKASNLIQKKYSEELLRPELSLNIIKPRPIRVSVIGEIQRPGIYSFTEINNDSLQGSNIEQNNGLPTIVEAIQKAGGVSLNANLKEVEIVRRLPGIEAKYKKANVNLLDFVLKGSQEQNLFLFDGDTIKLNKASSISKDSLKIAKSNLSQKTITVNIVGQVNNPGKIKIPTNTPLFQAIYMAGGPVDWRANKGNVDLVRIKKNGTAFRKKFKINLNQNLSQEINPPLIDQDIVYVRSNNLNRISSGLGALTDTISPAVTALTLFKLLE